MFVTPSVIELSGEYTFTAVGNVILKWKRFSIVGRLESTHSAIKCLLVMGNYLISASVDGYVTIWNWDSEEEIRTINLGQDFEPSFVMHPPTYLNKVLIGSASGGLQLWNIRTGSLIMSFQGYSAGITFIEPAPAVDVVAIGLRDGTIDLRNLRFDQVSTFPRWMSGSR